jgi:hypothetical protein
MRCRRTTEARSAREAEHGRTTQRPRDAPLRDATDARRCAKRTTEREATEATAERDDDATTMREDHARTMQKRRRERRREESDAHDDAKKHTFSTVHEKSPLSVQATS